MTSERGNSSPPWWVLVLALGAGGVGSVGYQVFNPPRPDPWTGTQAMHQSQQFRREWKLDLREMELAIRADMPPLETRARIIALESAVRFLMSAQGEKWDAPTQRFSHDEGPNE